MFPTFCMDGSILHGIVKSGLCDKTLASEAKEHEKKANAFRRQASLRILRDLIDIETSESNTQMTIVIQLNESWGRYQLGLVEKLIYYLFDCDKIKMTFLKVRFGSIIITILAKTYKGTFLTELLQQKTQFMHLTGLFGLVIGENTLFQEDENDNYAFEQGLLEVSVTGHLQAV